MFTEIKKSRSLSSFLKGLEEGDSFVIENLPSAPKALLATLAVKALKRSVLLVTGGTREDKLFDDLLYFAPDLCIEFPSWETLPGEEITPSPDIVGKRFEALYQLHMKKGPAILVCPLQALLQKVASKEEVAPLLTIWNKGMRLAFDQIAEKLTKLGYRREAVVSDKGQFAVRGGILDLFPLSSSDPYRIEFFGDEIEQIRTFDPIGQKSVAKVDRFFLSPGAENLTYANRLVSITEHFHDPHPLIFWDDLLAIEDTYVSLKQMPGAKSPYLFTLPQILEKKSQQIFCTQESVEHFSAEKKGKDLISFEAFENKFEARYFLHSFQPILDYTDPQLKLIFLNATDTDEQEVRRLMQAVKLPPHTEFKKGYISSGFLIADIPFGMVPSSEITHRTHIRRQKWRSTYHTPASEFHALSPGDLVVHYHSGIGRYLGMEKQTNHLGVSTEFLSIQYSENSKLFVPLSQAYLVSRYIGTQEHPPQLSQLGSKRWQKTLGNATAQIVGYANELLQLYAERSAKGGYVFPEDSEMMRQFETDFPYQETEDQLLAIKAIREDMTSSKAMDRLVCGDVGYGKTEVAMRAAFKAVVDGQKQVAVLVPTTVLAMQHFDTFKERMRGFPVEIEVVSRSRTPKQAKEILEKVRLGKIDILIGTHRLLSQDVEFKDLGLLIVDEEQRFGVRAKEKLKKYKNSVDCLMLSATPIPRTLYMSIVHARDMSVINTPPQDRLPIKTIIAEMDPDLIQNALMREFSRGGQAFFIHNRVETIYGKAEAIQKKIPSIRIGVVHGQMDEEDVDTLFHQFKQQEIDLLFATTIVENGIDVPNANTILIDRADTYGLADLYQLRGRVGRWNRAAYAYFLIPKNARLPEPARKRLNALVEAGGHGGGMKIAMRDLEIRGAGDLLGVQQSGQVSAIGFHLYCKLLKRAIDALKNKKVVSFNETKMEYSYDARIPDTYIDAVSIRMEIYHRLGEASSFEEIDSLLDELKDRFGEPPTPVLWLYHLSRVRTFAAAHHFSLLKFSPLTFFVERVKGKESIKKTILLPKKEQTPEVLEHYVIEQLKTQFELH